MSTSSPVEPLPRRLWSLSINSDACARQVWCILQQVQEGRTIRPIGYWSQTLNKEEDRYDKTRKECLAVVWSKFVLRFYIERSQFTIRTYHQTFKRTLFLKKSSGRQARRRLRLMEYELGIINRAGIEHQDDHALSRVLTTKDDETAPENDLSI